jgi:hypothetical protein
MSFAITNEYFEELASHCEDMELNSVWWWVRSDSAAFDEAREAFLIVLRRLLDDGHIKLIGMQSDRPMEGSIEEQVDQFRKAFPKNDAEMEEGLWFFAPGCPGGCNWKWKR